MRLFLAIDLPQDARARLADAQDALRRACRGWRFVRPASIHLTLRFLGEVVEHDIAAQDEDWRGAVESLAAVRFRVAGSGVFPARGTPRLLWAGVVDERPSGGLRAIADALEARARELGFPHESRPFRPHLTLARAGKGAARPEPPPAGVPGGIAEVEAREVVLFRSELRPDGARYAALASYPLAGGPG